VKCYRGAGLMPLCLLESQLNCAGRLPGMVGDPSLGPAGHIHTVMNRKFFICIENSFTIGQLLT
jgi:hypothetical protein